jgi:zinc protease
MIASIARGAALLAALGGAALPLAAQGQPKTPPPAGPLTAAPFPPFQEAVLPNGVRLLVVENHRQPVVSMSLSFSAGSSFDPAGKEGLASMTAGLLT